MVWEKQKYTKFEINNAGKILINDKSSEEKKDRALEILDNWRATHSYPMHIFQMRLKNKSQKVDENSLTAQRLKRVPAIIYKLKRSYNGRKPSMKLHQMQDIGGCRAVLSNITQVRELCEKYYLKGDLKHKRVGFKDYIADPKTDGYRSIHLVYEYKSDKGKQEFNGLRVEVQIRSKLQHFWATAIETVDFFTRQAIKSSEGHPDWMDFFKLVSSAFAKMEDCPCVFGTPEDEKELYSQIKKREEELNIISKMSGWTSAMGFFEQEIKNKKKKKVQFFLLELDILGEKLNIKSYTKEEEQKAIIDYSALEKRHTGRKDYDVVLVGVDKANDLKKAYPNYFVDTTEFLNYLQKIINKYK
jgi:ppGpp synthetase/RelA/SpoT-type nucleotidyltranferase